MIKFKYEFLSYCFAMIIIILFFSYPKISSADPQQSELNSIVQEKTNKKYIGKNFAQHKISAANEPYRYQILNINNLWTWAREDGISSHSPAGDNGTYYPRGMCWVVYQDGFIFGSKAYLDVDHSQPAPFGQMIRVGGARYGSSTRSGWIGGTGVNATAVAPNDPVARIYRIRRDWREMSRYELRQDAAEWFESRIGDVNDSQIEAIVNDYEWCWNNWPVQHGAPFIDRDGNGMFNPPPSDVSAGDLAANGYDEPGIAGANPASPADQVIWTVFNDLDRETSTDCFGSEPTGLEIQMTIWGYRRYDALGNIFFRKWKIINKGGVEIDEAGTRGAFYLDSMYVSQWSDPDIGDYSDDLVGCDTVLNMGYAYNANALDAEFQKWNMPPPAVGYDILQGPIVPSPGNVANCDFRLVPDFENLGMTGFVPRSASSPYVDPIPLTPIQWYKMLRGFQPILGSDERYLHPPGITPGPFALAGDPTTGVGHIDGQGFDYSPLPGDRRLLINSGPFQLAPGDTQQVVVAFVAGLGSDWRSSLAVMKYNDRVVQTLYDNGLALPRPPPAPALTFKELDNQIILMWGEDQAKAETVENHSIAGFQFEGYNVYQLPSATASLKDGKKLATFDRINNVTRILVDKWDDEIGTIVPSLLQKGSDSGLDYKLTVKWDEFETYRRLLNGKEYYFAITAYNYNPEWSFIMPSLESEPTIVSVTPHKFNPGERWDNAYGDSIHAVHSQGNSEGRVTALVIDPANMTGDSYKVSFYENVAGEINWKLTNTTKDTILLSGMTNQQGNSEYLITEGIQTIVSSPPAGVQQNGVQVVSGTLSWTWQNANGFSLEGFSGAIGWGGSYPFNASDLHSHQLHDVIIKFAETDWNGNVRSPDDPNYSFGYRYLIHASDPPAKPEFEPFITNPTGNFSFQGFSQGVPFAAYVYDRENGNVGRRLAIGFCENNVEYGMVDGKWWPPISGNANNTSELGPREWFWIFDIDYSEIADPLLSGQNSTMYSGQPKPIVLWGTVARKSNQGASADDALAILFNRVNSPADEFVFQTRAASYDEAAARADVLKMVNVFPNPCYRTLFGDSNQSSSSVTFIGLPPQAKVRIFNLTGNLVRVITKNDDSQFLKWDLTNFSGRFVASGMYIAHIKMPKLGVSKVLKLAIVQ